MKNLGYSWLKGVNSIEYVTPVEKPRPKKEVPSASAAILDAIFCKDVYGWPQSSLACYLSDKTADDVRAFIERNILVNTGDGNLVTDEKYVAEFKNLSDEFIAQASRNRFESIEDYESRISKLVQEDQDNAFYEKAKSWREKFFSDLK